MCAMMLKAGHCHVVAVSIVFLAVQWFVDAEFC